MVASHSVEFGRKPGGKGRAPRLSRTGLAYALFAGLALSNAFTLVGLFMAPEISTLFSQQDGATLSAYQNRILQLRMEVDRLQSRQYRQDGDLNLQMQQLTQQQEVLSEQYRYVRVLAEKASELGLTPEEPDAEAPAQPPMLTSAATNNDADKVADISRAIDLMLTDSRTALDAISGAADKSTGEIVDGLASVGIRLDVSDTNEAVGGPFIPAEPDYDDGGMADTANQVLAALDRFEQARDGLDGAPIHYPFTSRKRVSSIFGNRRDPFTGAMAFHSGLDLAAPRGTPVLAAGSGKVVYAGVRSGYGNTIEIDHGGGILSRYGHLSAIGVRVGQLVTTGDKIGNAGSTGRSTGPHLHFEIRRNDSPQNPVHYLDLAKRLANYIG